MRAGELRHRATILELDSDLRPVEVGRAWLGIQAKEGADVPAAAGLRSPAKLDIRARYSSALRQGRYLRHGERLMQITSARDPLGNRAELRITADEFIGDAAEYRPQEGLPVPCRVHLTHSAPWLDDMGAVTDYKTRGEVLLIEVGRPQVGDMLKIGSDLYAVIAYADESDDGVVRGLWLERF